MPLEIDVGSIKGKLNGIHFTLQLGSRGQTIPINIPGDKAESILAVRDFNKFKDNLQALTDYYLNEPELP